jgi:CheY-like chemotaxis protein
MASQWPLAILVVDDDTGVRDLLRDVLSEQGFAVLTARHGAEALDILSHEPAPSLILLDMVMPVMDGGHFLELLRARDELKRIPVLVTSATNEKPSMAEGFLAKPFALRQLFDAIASAIGRCDYSTLS